jgi:hypothetical protein
VGNPVKSVDQHDQFRLDRRIVQFCRS